MYQRLRCQSHGLTTSALELTRELIRTPSESLHEKPVSDLVARTLEQTTAFDKVVQDEYGNVLGVMFGLEAGPTLLLATHLDTVAPVAPEAWESSPYAPTCNGDRLTGVGAADCKAGLAAQLFAAVALKRSLLPLRGNLVVAAVVSEENGISLGMRFLVEHTLPSLDLVPAYAVLGEPTDLGLYYGHEGWVKLDVHVNGRDLFRVTDAGAAAFEDFSVLGASSQFAGSKQNLLVAEPRVDRAGAGCHAVIGIQRRLLRGEALNDVLSGVRRSALTSVRSTGDVGIEVEVQAERQALASGHAMTVECLSPPWSLDPFSPLLRRAHQSLTAADCSRRSGEWFLDRLGMGTSGGLLVNSLGVPTIGYGPGPEHAAHACNEYVEVSKVAEALYGTAAIAHGLVGVPVYGWTDDEI